MILTSTLLPAAMALGTALPAQDGASKNAPANPALQRALDTISADEIKADLMFVASDEMAGRDSPSPQLKVAARFIRSRLMRFGFVPAAPDDSYLYEWQINSTGFDPAGSSAEVVAGGRTISFAYDADYLFPDWGSLGKREVSGEVVFGGDMSADTLDEIDVEGRWVLSATGKGVSRRRRRGLEKAGALGVLVLPAADAEKSVEETFRPNASRMTGTRLSFDGGGRSRARTGFPIVHLKEGPAGRLPMEAVEAASPGDVLSGWRMTERCSYGDLGKVTLENVVGLWPGSDPKLKNEVIILSAHYDHVGVGSDGQVYNGADDNGSGTCGMLALAEALKEYGPMRRSVMLMWVSAEEKGLLGSEAWTKDPYLPEGMKALCNINIDMIGRNASNEFLITPTRKHKAYSALTRVAEANASLEGFDKIGSADAYWARSDHANFERNMGLPVAFLFCDVHEDYHKPTDTPDKINYDKMRRICRLVVRMLEALQIDRPKF